MKWKYQVHADLHFCALTSLMKASIHTCFHFFFSFINMSEDSRCIVMEWKNNKNYTSVARSSDSNSTFLYCAKIFAFVGVSRNKDIIFYILTFIWQTNNFPHLPKLPLFSPCIHVAPLVHARIRKILAMFQTRDIKVRITFRERVKDEAKSTHLINNAKDSMNYQASLTFAVHWGPKCIRICIAKTQSPSLLWNATNRISRTKLKGSSSFSKLHRLPEKWLFGEEMTIFCWKEKKVTNFILQFFSFFPKHSRKGNILRWTADSTEEKLLLNWFLDQNLKN